MCSVDVLFLLFYAQLIYSFCTEWIFTISDSSKNALTNVRMHLYTSHYQYSCNVNTPSGLLFPPLLCSHPNDQTQQRKGCAALTVTLSSQSRKNGSPNTLSLLNLSVPSQRDKRQQRSWTATRGRERNRWTRLHEVDKVQGEKGWCI